MSEQTVAIQDINLSLETQSRQQISDPTVKEYSDLWKEGTEFPPVDLFFDGKTYWIGAGFHRVLSRKLAGFTDVQAVVHSGTRKDAVLFAAGSNKNGLGRSNKDKRKAVTLVLLSEDCQDWDEKQIAKHCGVTVYLVNQVKKDLNKDPDSPVSQDPLPVMVDDPVIDEPSEIEPATDDEIEFVSDGKILSNENTDGEFEESSDNLEPIGDDDFSMPEPKEPEKKSKASTVDLRSYLEGLSIYGQVPNDKLKRDVKAFLVVEEKLEQLKDLLRPVLNWNSSKEISPLGLAVKNALNISNPKDWQKCITCTGLGKSSVGDKMVLCKNCNGCGYFVN